MPTKPVATRAITATTTGCVRRGPDIPFSKSGNDPAVEDDGIPSILQLHTEGLIVIKTSVMKKLA